MVAESFFSGVLFAAALDFVVFLVADFFAEVFFETAMVVLIYKST
jgi:hypothetical protein